MKNIEEESNNHWIIWLIVIGVVFFVFFNKAKYEGKTAEEWFNQYNEAQTSLDKVNENLDLANGNIEKCNNGIKNAKSYVGGSYKDIEYALESLGTVETIE